MAAALSKQKYYVFPSGFLAPSTVASIRSQAVHLREIGRLEQSYSVEHGPNGVVEFPKPGVYACEPDGSDYEDAPDMLHYMSAVITTLPGTLSGAGGALNLRSDAFGVKLAVTEPGSVYPRHVDAVEAGDTRKVTVILYLNEEGQEGGELRLWNEDGSPVDIKPEGAVAFLADEVEVRSERGMRTVVPSESLLSP